MKMRPNVKMLMAVMAGTMMSGRMASIKASQYDEDKNVFFGDPVGSGKSKHWRKRKMFKMNTRKQCK